MKRIGPMAYQLELPPTTTIHPIFHVSQLKQLGNTVTSQQLPPQLKAALEWVVELARILGVCQAATGL